MATSKIPKYIDQSIITAQATAVGNVTLNMNLVTKWGHLVSFKIRAIANEDIPENTVFMKLPFKPIQIFFTMTVRTTSSR